MRESKAGFVRAGIGSAGFTLLEMAFVVALIGLIVGGGVISVGPIILQADINTTNNNLDQIEASLVLFAAKNNRLPCPADGSLNNTQTNYGLEQVNTQALGTAQTCAVTLTNSVIPWRTLAMDETYSIDGWGMRIAYFPANGAITGVASLIDNNGDTCLERNVTSANRNTICDTATTGLVPSYPYANYIAVYSITYPTAGNAGNAACGGELTVPPTNQTAAAYAPTAGTDTCTVAPSGTVQTVTASNVQFEGGRAGYVLISHGQSTWYAWNKAGNQIKPPGAAGAYPLKYANSGVLAGMAGTANNLGFLQGTPNLLKTNTQYFDDIVRWRAPSFVIQLCNSGSCGNP